MAKDRYVIDLREGVVAVYDTHHPRYDNPKSISSDAPFTVAAWPDGPSNKNVAVGLCDRLNSMEQDIRELNELLGFRKEMP